MNRKEWKELCKVDKRAAHYWYNIVKSKLLSKEFESDPRTDKDAKVIHHLRDTEEQRKYNDEHYELFGLNLDGTFEYGKYVVFWTKKHHDEYHSCSEETRRKRSDSLKGKPKSEEWRKKLSESNKGKHYCSDMQRKQISESVSSLWESEDYRECQSRATKEAMWRPDVRQRLLDGCKKRPPQSKESRRKAAEKLIGRHHTDEAKQKMSLNKKEYYKQLHFSQAVLFNYTQELQKLCTAINTKYSIAISDVMYIINLISSVHGLENMSSAKDASYIFYNSCVNNLIDWNTFQSIFFKVRKLFVRRIKYEQLL